MSRNRFRPLVYQLEKNNHFTTKVSTTTNDEIPNVVFLRAKVRITPLLNKKSYETEINTIRDIFNSFTKNVLDNNVDYDKNYIFTFDVAEKSVRYKKTTHLRYDIYLKPKNEWTLLQHKQKLTTLSEKLDNKLIDLFKQYNLNWF